MMDSLQLLTANLLSPPVIAFFAGILARVTRSDVKFPAQLYDALTIYLLLAIGFKGGTSLAQTPAAEMVLPILAVAIAGTSIPLLAYFVSRKMMGFKVEDSAALAAHYGSVSAVTFIACLAFLDFREVVYENYLPALMALMEIPAIMVGLLLARLFTKDNAEQGSGSLKVAIQEVLSGKSIFLLITGLVAGAFAGPEGFTRAKPFLIDPFYGVLILFLLEMGLTAGKQLAAIRESGVKLILFGVCMPLIQALIGLALARMAGLSVGGTTAFMVLSASASYIAAPAAVRIAIPQANPGQYLTASLGITFPFNLVAGIPIYFLIASWAESALG